MLNATLATTTLAAILATLLLARYLRLVARRPPAGLLQSTEADLALLFIFVSAARLRLATLLAVGVTSALGWIFDLPWLAIALVAGSIAFVPRLVVKGLRRRWRHRLTAQLPDALALWAGLLRAGQAMAPALSQLASRQADPLGGELRLVLSQYRLGVGLDVAMGQFRDRAAVADLRMLATLLRAHRELGGNLAEALERLAAMLRNRLAIEARIRSLTAQGRLQGMVVGALPLLLGVILCFMEPDSMKSMFVTPVGWAALSLLAVLEIAGFTMIRRIVNIDV
jgi:tight adherence protein B